MRNIVLIFIVMNCSAQGNLLVREIFGGKGKISYNNNTGKAAADPNPNSPQPCGASPLSPCRLYNGLATRGEQASAGLYPNSNGMTMSPDGRRVFAVNHNGNSEGFVRDAVTQFNLTTAWDLTTMSGRMGSSPDTNNFLPGVAESSPRGAYFSPDGLNLYIAGGSTFRVLRYVLSTPYEVSTAVANTSFPSGLNSLDGISFSQDGTRMFLIGTGSFIRSYTLSTAWNISTATNDSMSLNLGTSNGQSLFFNPDGLSFYTYDGKLNKYCLLRAWDLSSYLITQSSITLSTLTPLFGGGVYFNPDGTQFFISNYTACGVKRFELRKPFKVK